MTSRMPTGWPTPAAAARRRSTRAVAARPRAGRRRRPRRRSSDGDRVVLIVEDDADFAKTVLEMARERGFKGIVALARRRRRRARARVQARRDHPRHDLPVQDGWQVLDHLKHHPETRHIPVHIVSGGVQNGGGRTRCAPARSPCSRSRSSKDALDDAFAQDRSSSSSAARAAARRRGRRRRSGRRSSS